jgi:hypothetical protein
MEAKALLKVGMADGAYYLAGYAVECASKACISKGTKRYEFPDKERAVSSYSHKLQDLVKVAGLEQALAGLVRTSPEFRTNWEAVKSWTEQSRPKASTTGSRTVVSGSWRQESWSNFVDQSALVSIEIQRGVDVLAALDRAKVTVSVALFANLTEYGDWRMVLAARALDELGLRKAYGLIFESLTAAGISVEKTPSFLIFPMNDSFIRDIRRMYGKSKNVEGLILRTQSFGDRFVEGAYVYRIR